MASTSQEKPSFEYYTHLPYELRRMVINRMGTIDRCRFVGASRSTSKEVKKSKNYLYEMAYTAKTEKSHVIEMVFEKYEHPKRKQGFKLVFEEENNQKCMKYVGRKNIMCWKYDLAPSADLTMLASGQFKKLLAAHQNNIKMLTFRGKLFKTDLLDYDFGIHRLSNVEELQTCNGINTKYLLSLIPKPLENFTHYGDKDTDMEPYFEKVCQVTTALIIIKIPLNYEQFRQLNATQMVLPIQNFTVENIWDYIECWMSGKISNRFEHCVWGLNKSGFDEDKFFRYFKRSRYEPDSQHYVIKQRIPNGKNAVVRTYIDGKFKGIVFSLRGRN